MADVITTVTSVVTAAFGWAGQAVTFVVENPLVGIFVMLPLVGLGIGFFKRIIA